MIRLITCHFVLTISLDLMKLSEVIIAGDQSNNDLARLLAFEMLHHLLALRAKNGFVFLTFLYWTSLELVKEWRKYF